MSGIQSPDEAFRSKGATDVAADRDEQGRFLSGRKGGPGRRKGSRVKLAEDVVTDVLDSWRQHGPVVLERLACLDPGKYADFIAKVLPREVKIEHTSNLDDVSDEMLSIMIEHAERIMAAKAVPGDGAKPVTVIDLQPTPIGPPPPTSAEQRAAAQQRDLHDQHDALAAAAPALPSQALPHPVGRASPEPSRTIERRNIAKLDDRDDVDPASLF